MPERQKNIFQAEQPSLTSVENFEQKKITDLLERDGILEKHQGVLVMDIERFMSKDYLDGIYNSNYLKSPGVFTRDAIFQNLSGNFEVVSKDDYELFSREGRKIESKPLFYIPDSKTKAFDPESIRNRSSHLDFWDIYQSAADRGISVKNWDIKITLGNGEQISLREFYLATRLFGDFQARRNQRKLEAFDYQKNSFVPVSAKWIKRNIGAMGKQGIASSAHRFFADHCKNLLNSGLISLRDFRIEPGDVSGTIMRKEKDLSQETSEYIMINGVRYYITKDNFNFEEKTYPRESIKIAELDKNTWGIIFKDSNREKILCTFNLISEEEKNKKKESIINNSDENLTNQEICNRTIVSVDEMKLMLRPWRITENNPGRKGDGGDTRLERLLDVGDYGYVRNMGDEFFRQTGIGMHNLNWREQLWLSAAFFNLTQSKQKQEIYDFTNKYGLAGLKTFLTCEFDLENGKKILDIGKNMPPIDAMKIFQKVGEIIKLAEDKKQEITGMVYEKATPDMEQDVREKLLWKANEIIINFSDAEKKDVVKLLADLESSRVEIMLLTSTLNTLKDQGKKVGIEDIRGMDVAVYEVGELVGEKKEEFRRKYEKPVTAMMEKSYAKIFAANPKAREKVKGNFEERFDNLENYRIYVLMFQGEAVAFSVIRPGNAEGEVISESTVVHPDAQKYSLGIAFLKKIMERESEKFTIRGKTRVNNPANDRYEEIGLKIDRERPTFIEEGEEYYWLKMESKKNSRLEYDKAA